MLHVFHVDSGRMMTFDMGLALESVDCLKRQVQQEYKIAADKQVLLISGGECLDPKKRVCAYSAGTDTNPIFLFSKSIIESPTPPPPCMDYGNESDIDQKVKEHCDMPVTFSTVTKRSQLAQFLVESARNQMTICENLVHDQHLQQQGWSAVVANLEDITLEFRKRSEIFEKSVNEYIEERESYMKFLGLEDPDEEESFGKKRDKKDHTVLFSISPVTEDGFLNRVSSRSVFNTDLKTLQRIPVLPALLDTDNQIEDLKVSEEDETSTSTTSATGKEITLYEWISAADNRSTMDQLYELCSRGLEQFDKKKMLCLSEEITDLLKNADNIQMKEVKGLGERLSGLETLMREARNFVKQQTELAQSFAKNENRASNTRDSSVLPDLCISHKRQLQMMAQNHAQICDIRRRCSKAKEELSVNLYHRLKWVMYIEDHILETDQKLVIYHENLKRLRRHLEVLRQIHLAPTIYLCAITEVVRRRAFSQNYLLWASELACNLLAIHNEEVARRKDFQSQFEGHFLNSLFPGLEDIPPNYATQAPAMFDTSLPKITLEDVDKLKKELPDLAENLNVPDNSALANLFLSRFLSGRKEETQDVKIGGEEVIKAVEEKLIQAVCDVGLASDLDRDILRGTGSEPCLTTAAGLPHLRDLDRGCESETDTEEFEKVGQSPLELNFDKNISSSRPRTQDASTCTEVSDTKTSSVPPKKPPRTFHQRPVQQENSFHSQRTMSGSSNTDSFTNIKHPSLESIEEFTNLRPTDSCSNLHCQGNPALRSKSISPHTPQSPQVNSPLGHQSVHVVTGVGDFSNDEFYIDESLPSSLSIETGHSQSSEFIKQLDTAHNVVALLQDNLQVSRSEHDKLKSILGKLHQLANETTLQLRSELDYLKLQIVASRNSASQHCDSLTSSWENLLILREHREKEKLEALIEKHEYAINEYRNHDSLKTKRIEDLLDEKSNLENEISKSSDNLSELKLSLDKLTRETTEIIEDLRKQLQEKEMAKEKILKETSDRLTREHKAEIENIRARFKLMTMERSPSESNIEKSPDFSSLPSNSLLIQMQDNFEMDKHKAVVEALIKERENWALKIEEIKNQYSEDKDISLKNLAKKISEEKDKQIDILMEREKNLNLECIKYKSTIQQLAESGEDTRNEELLKRINTLQAEKEEMLKELENLKNKKDRGMDMGISIAVCEDKVDVMTSPIKLKDVKRMDSFPKGMLTIESCKPGDRVIVVWDKDHENYRVIQEKQHLYFLHSDYLEALGFEISNGEPNKHYCVGEVIDKEYCCAKKSENRYKVPKCTKFFRVKVVRVPTTLSRDVSETSRMTQSQSAVAYSSEEITFGSKVVPQSLPPSPTRTHPIISEKDELDSTELELDANVQNESTQQWPKQHFAEDSGIVESMDNIEQAVAVLDNTLIDLECRSDNSDRNEDLRSAVNKTIDDTFLVV